VALSFVNIIVDQIWLKATIFGLLMPLLPIRLDPAPNDLQALAETMVAMAIETEAAAAMSQKR